MIASLSKNQIFKVTFREVALLTMLVALPDNGYADRPMLANGNGFHVAIRAVAR